MVVEPPDDEVLLANEALLGLVGRVLFEGRGLILVVVEGRLVGDDEVPAGLRGALQHAEGGHAGRGDARDRGLGIAGLERVHGFRSPGNALLGKPLTNARDDFLGRHASGLQ